MTFRVSLVHTILGESEQKHRGSGQILFPELPVACVLLLLHFGCSSANYRTIYTFFERVKN